MRILVVSHLWPRTDWQHLGTFVSEQVISLSGKCDVSTVVPVDKTVRMEELVLSEVFRGFSRYRKRVRPELLKMGEVEPIRIYFRRNLLLNRFTGQAAQNLSNVLATASLPKFDVVHAHTIFPDGLACALWLEGKTVPLVVTGHGSDIHSLSNSAKNVLGPLFERADALVPVSRFLGDKLERLGAEAEKIFPLPNGFPGDQFSDVGPLERDLNKIVFLGRLDDVKRVDLLIRAVALCDSEIKLDIAGDGRRKKEYQTLVSQLGIGNRVRFLGMISRQEVPKLLAGAALLCLVSTKEGWPTVIFESLACGASVLATAVGGIPEALQDPKLGRIVPADITPESLAEEIDSALQNKWDRQYMIKHAFQHSWDKITDQLLILYDNLLRGKADKVSDHAEIQR